MEAVKGLRCGVGICLVLAVSFLGACAPPAMAPATIPAATMTLEPTPAVTKAATLVRPPASTPEQVILESLSSAAREWSAKARQDLVDRLKVSADDIRLVKAEEMQWSDSSLGCPQPGMMYAQVITPGYQIVLEHGGAEFDYRVGNNHLVLCEPTK